MCFDICHFLFQRYNCGFKANPIIEVKYLARGIPFTFTKAKPKAKAPSGTESMMAKAILKKENKIKILLEKFSIDKEEIVFVGDTISDIKASKTAGIKSLAAAWGYQSRSKLKKSNPDYIADKPQDVIKILEKIDGKNAK